MDTNVLSTPKGAELGGLFVEPFAQIEARHHKAKGKTSALLNHVVAPCLKPDE